MFDVGADNRVSNGRLFTNCMVDEVKCGPDGLRCDVDGNVWLSSNAGRVARLQRRHGMEPRGQAARPHPPSRSVRQCRVRRTETQPPVHGGEPVDLRALRGTQGRPDGKVMRRGFSRADEARLKACLYTFCTLVAATEPSACLSPLTVTLSPLFSEEHAPPSNTVAALVVTEKPLTPNWTDGQVPFSPPTSLRSRILRQSRRR